MEPKKDIDLRGAIPETPEMCRQAVLQAVRTYREESTMKKPFKAILIAVLLAALLCSTGFAIAHYYSVRDYVAGGQPSQAFDSAVVPLEETQTAQGLTFSLGDAIFDGHDLAFTLCMEAQEGAEPLYVYPSLTGYCGERALNLSYDGFDRSYLFGFFLPSASPDTVLAAEQGVAASLYQDTAEQEVTWRYTLSLYRPTGELVSIRDWNDQSETYTEYEAYLRALHADGKIGCWRGVDIMDWLNALDTSSGAERTFAQRMEETGLLELADQITFTFTTASPANENRAKTTEFAFDGYTVTVKSITQSFMRVDYTLEVVYDQPQGREHDIDQHYALTDQEGTLLPWRESRLSLAEDKKPSP